MSFLKRAFLGMASGVNPLASRYLSGRLNKPKKGSFVADFGGETKLAPTPLTSPETTAMLDAFNKNGTMGSVLYTPRANSYNTTRYQTPDEVAANDTFGARRNEAFDVEAQKARYAALLASQAQQAAPAADPFDALMAQMRANAPQFQSGLPSLDSVLKPYDEATGRVNTYADQARGVIGGAGDALKQQLAAMQADYAQRAAGVNDQIGAGIQKAQAQATGALDPVLADLQAQGVNAAPVQGQAALGQANLTAMGANQQALAQRLAQVQSQADASRNQGAATMTQGAQGQLGLNQQNALGRITQDRAGAEAKYQQAAAAEQQRFQQQQQNYQLQLAKMQADHQNQQAQLELQRQQYTSPSEQTLARLANPSNLIESTASQLWQDARDNNGGDVTGLIYDLENDQQTKDALAAQKIDPREVAKMLRNLSNTTAQKRKPTLSDLKVR